MSSPFFLKSFNLTVEGFFFGLYPKGEYLGGMFKSF